MMNLFILWMFCKISWKMMILTCGDSGEKLWFRRNSMIYGGLLSHLTREESNGIPRCFQKG
jgi:hypothetical protein